MNKFGFTILLRNIKMFQKLVKLILLIALAVLFGNILTGEVHAQVDIVNWPMAGANPQRTSWANTSPQNISGITWYRPIEAYIDQKTQLVSGNGHVYVATTKGLVVLNAENGNLDWRFDMELPIGHTPTVDGNMIYFGSLDGKVYALRDNGGSAQLVWTFTGAKSGFSVSPVVAENKVFLGGRDGYFYALNAASGSLAWQYPSGQSDLGPLLNSPAYGDGVIYFAASDQYAYALNSSSGSLIWKSPQKLPGERYQSWWPVVYGSYVVFSAAPGYKNEFEPGTKTVASGVQTNIKGVFRDSFFGTQTGNTGSLSTADSSSGWPTGSSLLDTQSNSISMTLESYFTTYRHRRVYPALNKSNGAESTVLPFIYTGTYSGNVYPPIVNPNTGGLYAFNMYSGSGGAYQIARASLMGWKPGNRYLHVVGTNRAIDEPISHIGAGTGIFFNLCCDRSAGNVSGSTWWSYGGNLLEQVLPSQGAANSYDPMWRKFSNALERLNSYYAGDASRTGGVRSRNGVYNSHGLQNPLTPYSYTNQSGQRVDRLFTHRSNTIIALGTNSSKTPLALVQMNAVPANGASTRNTSAIEQLLNFEIDKIIDVRDASPNNGFLNPGYYNDGTPVTGVSDYYFTSPSDGLITLCMAYPLVSDANLKSRLSAYLQAYFSKYFGSTPISKIGWTNQPRENMEYPPEILTSMSSKTDTSGTIPMRGFYGLWKYAQIFPSQANAIYTSFRPRLIYPSNLSDSQLVSSPYTFNDYIAGYRGFLNLQELAYNGNYPSDVATLRNNVTNELNNLLSRRASQFAKDHPYTGELDNPNGTLGGPYNRQFNFSRNFWYLTRELGDYMRQNNFNTINAAINEYMYLGPFWFAANTDVAFQEGVKQNLWDTGTLFLAKAYIQNASRAELSKYLDAPSFDRGDLFYIQKLVATLEAPATGAEPTATPTPTTVQIPGDANGDGRVDGVDYVIWLNHYNQNVSGANNGDFNNSGVVDGADYVIWLNNYSS